MPVPDTTPDRNLVIRRGLVTYIVAESKYDTVVIEEDRAPDGTLGRTGTYKDLGYKIISAIENGNEIPYVKREHNAAVPGRQDVAAEQVALLTATGANVPSRLDRAATGADLPGNVPVDTGTVNTISAPDQTVPADEMPPDPPADEALNDETASDSDGSSKTPRRR